MYWRRFAIEDMPLDDHDRFALWMRERWHEKDSFIEQYLTSGRFPGDQSAIQGASSSTDQGNYIETEVKLTHWWEIGNIFIVLAMMGLAANVLAKIWNLVLYGKQF
jgi:hypothetical protein